MAKQIKQFRYFKNGSAKNYPSGVVLEDFITGTAFLDNYPIVHLGIQTIPGVKFYLNNTPNTLMVDSTGIFEMDLEEKTEIDAINFETATFKSLVEKNNNGYLIVDIVYDDGGLINE